jgi:sarcosine/dimethylglycine N-methyltransferase
MADTVTQDRAHYRKTYDTPLSGLLSRIWEKSLHLGLFETPDEPLTVAHERTKLALAKAADLKPGTRVFEAACGTGETARFFVRKFGVSVVATNIAETQTLEARDLTRDAGLADSIAFALADYHNLPAVNRAFDVWLCQEALLYASDRWRVMEEAIRVVRPGGRIVLTDLLLADHVQGARRDDLMRTIRGPHMWSIEQWDRLFVDMGFRVIERHDWSDQARHTFAKVQANLDAVRADPKADFAADLIDGTVERIGTQLEAARRGELGWCAFALAAP